MEEEMILIRRQNFSHEHLLKHTHTSKGIRSRIAIVGVRNGVSTLRLVFIYVLMHTLAHIMHLYVTSIFCTCFHASFSTPKEY